MCQQCRKTNSDRGSLLQSEGLFQGEGGGDKTQIHPNMVFELGILFKAEEQRLGLIMA